MPTLDPDRCHFNRVVDRLITLFITILFLIYVCAALFVCIKPRGPLTFGELVPLEYFNWLTYTFIVVVNLYIVTLVITNICALGCSWLIYLIYFAYFLPRELCLNNRQYKTVSTLREIDQMCHVYRSFQVLHVTVSYVTGIVLLLCNAVFMSTIMYSNFTLAKNWSSFSMLIKVMILLISPTITIFWVVLLDIGRRLGDGTAKLLLSWKVHAWETKKERKLMSRFRKSCKPIKLSCGMQFVVGRTSVLKFLKGVTRGTMRALLASGSGSR